MSRTDPEIADLVAAFEGCTLPLEEWHHVEHLTVSVWYLSRFPEQEATRRIRAGILRYNASLGLHGYHETVTLAWAKLIAGFLREQEPDLSVSELTRRLLDATRCEDKFHLLAYYSREVIMTERARREWVPPDVQPLELVLDQAAEVAPRARRCSWDSASRRQRTRWLSRGS